MIHMKGENAPWKDDAVFSMTGSASQCGECNLCDLDPNKICDNCGKCIGLSGEGGPEYRAIKVDGILGEGMDPDEYLYDDEVPSGPAEDEDMFPFLGRDRRL